MSKGSHRLRHVFLANLTIDFLAYGKARLAQSQSETQHAPHPPSTRTPSAQSELPIRQQRGPLGIYRRTTTQRAQTVQRKHC